MHEIFLVSDYYKYSIGISRVITYWRAQRIEHGWNSFVVKKTKRARPYHNTVNTVPAKGKHIPTVCS